MLSPMTLATAEPKSWVVIPAWSLPQPEAGPSQLPLPQSEAGPPHIPSSQKEMRPASPPEEVNLGSRIAMEVEYEYDWLMEEAGFKLVAGPRPVSKRQQWKGLCPTVYISSFNSIEALEKNYLAQSLSHSLTDPTLHWEREGVLNRIMVDILAMKNRPFGPALSIELPPPGETSVRFPWRPVPEHLANLPGIGELLTEGDPLLSQTRQLPCPLNQTSLRKAQWFNLCPTTDPFFKETVEVVKEIAPTWCMQDMHAIMWQLHEAYQSKKPMCFEIREDTPDNMRSMLFLWQHNPEGVPTAIQHEDDGSLNLSDVNIWMCWSSSPPPRCQNWFFRDSST